VKAEARGLGQKETEAGGRGRENLRKSKVKKKETWRRKKEL